MNHPEENNTKKDFSKITDDIQNQSQNTEIPKYKDIKKNMLNTSVHAQQLENAAKGLSLNDIKPENSTIKTEQLPVPKTTSQSNIIVRFLKGIWNKLSIRNSSNKKTVQLNEDSYKSFQDSSIYEPPSLKSDIGQNVDNSSSKKERVSDDNSVYEEKRNSVSSNNSSSYDEMFGKGPKEDLLEAKNEKVINSHTKDSDTVISDENLSHEPKEIDPENFKNPAMRAKWANEIKKHQARSQKLNESPDSKISTDEFKKSNNGLFEYQDNVTEEQTVTNNSPPPKSILKKTENNSTSNNVQKTENPNRVRFDSKTIFNDDEAKEEATANLNVKEKAKLFGETVKATSPKHTPNSNNSKNSKTLA